MEGSYLSSCDRGMSLESFPGMVRYTAATEAEPKPFCSLRSELRLDVRLAQEKVVMLATAAITEDNLFMNGLFQNIYIMYRMFEAMGWKPFLLVNMKPADMNKVPKYMQDVRLMALEEIAKTPIPVQLYIEIGMSTDASMRKYLKNCGAKIGKLYLGNIINIDIETPIFYPGMFFSHHVIGELDDIWVSPHYAQHGEYARAMNHISLNKGLGPVVPYVWDPQILSRDGERKFSWKPASGSATSDDVFVIVEPNISFQKCSLVPLMAIETWFRRNPGWSGEVVVVNGERLMLIPFFKESVWANLELVKAGRVKMLGRMDILTIMTQWPSAIPVCTQWNNEYNYMVLEYFHAGFPVLHNASDWSEYGYYYRGADLRGAADLIDTIRANHHQRGEVFRAHTRALLWRHSPYNPEVHARWNAVIESM